MNSLHGLAVRQTNSLQNDLKLLEESLSPDFEPSLTGSDIDRTALHGQIAATLSGLQRTISDYESLASKDIVDEKRQKGFARVEKFKETQTMLRQQFQRIKQQESKWDAENMRRKLFEGAGSTSATSSANLSRRGASSDSPFASHPSGTFTARENAALEEHSFIDRTSNSLDQFIANGQAILSDLQTQRDVMKGARRRLLSTANTLGLSRETIGFIERRNRVDFIIFVAGVILTFVCFYYIIKFFG